MFGFVAAPDCRSYKGGPDSPYLARVVADCRHSVQQRLQRRVRHDRAALLVDRGARLHQQALHLKPHFDLLQAPRAQALRQ
jgi:hypothetical protein